MRTLGRSALAVGKALLAQGAVVGFWLTLGLVLSLVFGVTGRFDRWVRAHNISPGTVASGDHSNRVLHQSPLNAVGEARIDCFGHF
jgi:hypothetical protein